MHTPRHLRRGAAAVTLAALPAITIAAAPTGAAQNPCDWDAGSWACLQYQTSGGIQPGDVVIPAGGGPPQVAVAPAPDGGPVVTAGGDVVIPAAPPIG